MSFIEQAFSKSRLDNLLSTRFAININGYQAEQTPAFATHVCPRSETDANTKSRYLSSWRKQKIRRPTADFFARSPV